MTRFDLARLAKAGVEAEIEKTCADVAEHGIDEYRMEKLKKLFKQSDEILNECKAARREELAARKEANAEN